MCFADWAFFPSGSTGILTVWAFEELQEIDLQLNHISSIDGVKVLYGRKVYFYGNPIPQEQLDKIEDKVDLEEN